MTVVKNRLTCYILKVLDITIKTIPHRQQVYETCGDYREKDGKTAITVSALADWRMEALVAVHELVEYFLIKNASIPIKDIDRFDIDFEHARNRGLVGKDDEPGDAPDAPYRKQHFRATNLERQLADNLGVNWRDYENFLANLYGVCHRRKKRP